LQHVGLTEVRIILESAFGINGQTLKFSKNLAFRKLSKRKRTIFPSDAVSPAPTFYALRQS